MNTKYNRFDRQGVYTCVICGKRTRNTGAGAEVEYCRKCYIEAEQENLIADTQPTSTIDFDRNDDYSEHSARCGNYEPCAICGRPIKNTSKAAYIHIVDGGVSLLLPGAEYTNEAADCGSFPVGADCLRKHPEYKPYVLK